jgi:hypothetical protein
MLGVTALYASISAPEDSAPRKMFTQRREDFSIRAYDACNCPDFGAGMAGAKGGAQRHEMGGAPMPEARTLVSQSRRRLRLFKYDHPRPIDQYIDYFGGQAADDSQHGFAAFIELLRPLRAERMAVNG